MGVTKLGAFLMLTVRALSLEPCSHLDSGGANSALFLTVQETNALALQQAKNTGPPVLDKYRDRLRIFGRLGDTISLTLGDVSVDPMGCNSTFEISPSADPEVFYVELKNAIDRDGGTASTLDDIDTYYCRITCQSSLRTIFYSLNIAVTDINDNPPEFLDTPYSKVISELVPIGTTVFRRISASDKDGERNKDVDFYILAGDGSELVESGGHPSFGIDLPRQGYVTVQNSLDFETLYYRYNRTYFNMTIQAKDTGLAPFSVDTYLTIFIEDGDDLGPMFVYDGCVIYNGLYPQCVGPAFSATVISNTLPSNGALITYPLPRTLNNQPVSIRARDQDTLNAQIQFVLEKTVFSSHFSVSVPVASTENGQVFYSVNLIQTKPIYRSGVQEFLLILRAQEISTNRRFTTAQIRVTVDPANNFAPSMISNTNQFVGYIHENAHVGTLVTNQGGNNAIKLTVNDPDMTSLDPTCTYMYERVINSTVPFNLSSEGFLFVSNKVLKFEDAPRYVFEIVVRETDALRPRSSTATMTVSVLEDTCTREPASKPTTVDVPLGTTEDDTPKKPKDEKPDTCTREPPSKPTTVDVPLGTTEDDTPKKPKDEKPDGVLIGVIAGGFLAGLIFGIVGTVVLMTFKCKRRQPDKRICWTENRFDEPRSGPTGSDYSNENRSGTIIQGVGVTSQVYNEAQDEHDMNQSESTLQDVNLTSQVYDEVRSEHNMTQTESTLRSVNLTTRVSNDGGREYDYLSQNYYVNDPDENPYQTIKGENSH